MNKYLKGCLIFLSVIILMMTGIIAWYYSWKARNQKQAQTDLLKFSKNCDTIRLITEKPSVELQNFNRREVNQLKFYLIRHGKIIKDSTLRYQGAPDDIYLYVQLPFDKFLKTDSIIVETKSSSKRFFSISGFHHYAYLYYGMMGYLGSYDCRFDDDNFMINGRLAHAVLIKQDGIKRNILPQ